MHVWSIDIKDEQERLVCTSRLTVMIIAQPQKRDSAAAE
jgi:acyl-coenzyme A thioesterase PaaI-like protein